MADMGPAAAEAWQVALRTILLDNKRRPLAEAESKPFTLTKAPSADTR